jgi:hypothetical protein
MRFAASSTATVTGLWSITLLFALVSCLFPSRAQGSEKTEIVAACAVALDPEITIRNSSESLRYSWLSLITESTYQKAQKEISAGGNANLLNLISAGGDASYKTFDEKRNDFLSHQKELLNRDFAESVFVQSLPKDAGRYFVDCLQLMSKSVGFSVTFVQEDAASAIARVSYYGTPGTTIHYSLTVVGGTGAPRSGSLISGGQTDYVIHRSSGNQIKVSAKGTEFPLSDFAISAAPKVVSAPDVVLIADRTWSPEGKPPADCAFVLEGTNVHAVAYNADFAPGDLVLRVGPASGPGPSRMVPLVPQTAGALLADRTLDDLSLGPNSELALQTGKVHVPLLTTPKSIEGCKTFTYRGRNSKVSVEQPPPVNVASTIPKTERIELTWPGGGFVKALGGVCDNGRCGDLVAGNLTKKVTLPIHHIQSVKTAGQVPPLLNGYFYRCGVEVGFCGVGEFTVLQIRESGPCENQTSCIAWRWSSDGHDVREAFDVTYFPLECIRYCQPRYVGAPSTALKATKART